MDRRQFLKFLAQSSASVGATVFVERVWGFPMVAALSSNKNKLFFWGGGVVNTTTTSSPPVIALSPTKLLRRHNFSSIQVCGTYDSATVAIGITQKGDIFTWGRILPPTPLPLVGTIDSPVLFGTTSTWAQISTNSLSTSSPHGIALRTAAAGGTVWTWGDNFYGQLGDGTTVYKSSPVQIGSVSTWTSVVAGNLTTYAIKSPGTLWSWGNKSYLGTISATNVSTPLQVGTFTDWSKLAVSPNHVLAIRNGALYAWGQNTNFQLGIGVAGNVSTPIQIGSETSWASVYATYFTSFAIKTNGSLWAWGYPGNAILGFATDVSTPVMVGSATDWVSICISTNHVIGMKTDSTIWGWGANDKGQLGTGSTSAVVTSPIQIGTNNTWQSIAIISDTSFGIRK